LDKEAPVFLLTVISKGKQSNVTSGEKRAIKKAAKGEKKQRRK